MTLQRISKDVWDFVELYHPDLQRAIDEITRSQVVAITERRILAEAIENYQKTGIYSTVN